MPGRVIGIELPMGYPGTFARTPDCIVMNRLVNANSEAIPFGAPVVLNADNTYSRFESSNTASDFGGIAVREVKQAIDYQNQNEVSYQPGEQCDVLERGNIVVTCGKGTPTAGGGVYIRVSENASYPGSRVGDFEAEADMVGSGNTAVTHTVLLTNAYWTTGRKDADGNAEITIKYKA